MRKQHLVAKQVAKPARSFFVCLFTLGEPTMYEIAGLLLTHVAMYLIGYMHGKRNQPLV